MRYVYDSVKGQMVDIGGDGPFAGIGGSTGTYDYNKTNPGVAARIAASKGQGSGEGLSGINAHFGGQGNLVEALRKILQSGKHWKCANKHPEIKIPIGKYCSRCKILYDGKQWYCIKCNKTIPLGLGFI